MNFKQFLESKGITQEAYEKMAIEEIAKLHGEFNDAIRKEMLQIVEDAKKAAGDVDLSGVIKRLETLETSNSELTTKTVADLKETIKNMGAQITDLKQKGDDLPRTIAGRVAKAMHAQKEKIQALKENKDGHVQLEFKAVADMTFATHITGQVGRTEREAGIVRDLQRTPILLDLFNVSGTNANLYEWVEKTGREGGVAMTAEGAVKPQGDFDLQLFSQKPKKEALIITISKEMLDDIDGMAAEVELEIREQIRLFTDDISLTGDGLGNNIEGMDANATAFAAGSFAATIDNANIFDAIRVAINQVELNNDYPTAVLMHPSDATAMELVKDPTTSQYIMPPFVTAGGVTIKGLPIRTSTVVTQGEAYVGNFSRFKVKIREDLVLDMGYRGIQGDWEKNMISFLGEMRLFAFIPANHYGSIVKLDLDVAIAALETP